MQVCLKFEVCTIITPLFEKLLRRTKMFSISNNSFVLVLLFNIKTQGAMRSQSHPSNVSWILPSTTVHLEVPII